MDMLPTSVLQVPDTSFLHGPRCGGPLVIGGLEQSYIADDRDVGHLPHMGGADRRLPVKSIGTWCKIELVKRHPFDEVTEGFGFEGGECPITEVLVGRPITLIDRIQQVLCETDQLPAGELCWVTHMGTRAIKEHQGKRRPFCLSSTAIVALADRFSPLPPPRPIRKFPGDTPTIPTPQSKAYFPTSLKDLSTFSSCVP